MPIPNIPKAKKPGTKLRTVAPHEVTFAKLPPALEVELTVVAIGEINETPSSIPTNPPINLFIIF